jgi:thioester reductase-like protein
VVFGKRIKVNKFPKNFKVQLFRVTALNGRTDYVMTNHHTTHNSVIDAQEELRRRWRIEQLQREEKQLTGLEKCQARLNRSQRNHICLATLAWHVLREAAQAAGQTIYEQKRAPLRTFMADQWRNPATTFVLSQDSATEYRWFA